MRAASVIRLALFALAILVRIPAGTAVETSDKLLTYRTVEKRNLMIEVFTPAGWQAADKRPAVLFFHGGGFTSGNRAQFAFQARYFASRGLVAATADYRTLDQHGIFPHKSIADGREAVRYLKRHAVSLGIDPGRVIVGGGSAGAIIAANTAFCSGHDEPGDDASISCRPAALLLFNPVFEFQPKHLAGLERIPALKDPKVRAEWLGRLEPLPNVSPKGPPAILFYGNNDPAIAGGRQFAGKSNTAGNSVEFWIADGQGHGFFNEAPWRNATLIQADHFLTELGFLEGMPTLTISKVALTKAQAENP